LRGEASFGNMDLSKTGTLEGERPQQILSAS